MRPRHVLFGFILLAAFVQINLEAQDTPLPILNEQTLRRDIETAGFYELIAWLEGLSQSTAGDRSALTRRLLDFYGLVEEPPVENGSTPLVVDSATRRCGS